jgi:hypothetical protein
MSSGDHNDKVEHIAQRKVKYEQLFQTLSEEFRTIPNEYQESRARVSSGSGLAPAGQATTADQAAYIEYLEEFCAGKAETLDEFDFPSSQYVPD